MLFVCKCNIIRISDTYLNPETLYDEENQERPDHNVIGVDYPSSRKHGRYKNFASF